MTAKAIQGQGTAHTPGASGSGSWRGAFFSKDEFDFWQTLGAAQAVSYQSGYDSDGFKSTGSNTFGGIFVPTGSAAIIPAGLAGLYRVSSSTGLLIGADAGGYQFEGSLRRNPLLLDTDTFDILLASGDENGWNGSAVISPGLIQLNEGDAIWMRVSNGSGGDAEIAVISRSWMLVEYLREWALDET